MGTVSARRYVSLASVVAILVVLHLYRPAVSNLWFDTFFDWLHVPVFALVSIGLFHALGEWRSNVNKAILAFGAALVLAVLSEAAQIPTSRDASWADIGADALGAAMGLFAIPTATQRIRLKIGSRVVAIILFIVSCLPLIDVGGAYAERNRTFPVIYDSDWPSRAEFMSLRGMAIDFRNLYPNWSEYGKLVIDIEVTTGGPFQLTVRVHDKEHLQGSQPHSDRFNRRFDLNPGQNVIEIPLSEIESGPNSRPLDLSRIDGLILFSNETEKQHSVRLHLIRLD